MKKLALTILGITALASFQVSAAPPVMLNASAPGTDNSGSQAISSDGNFVAFSSASSDLGFSDTNEAHDVFVRNLTTQELECVSKSDGGALGNYESKNPSISADGRYVAFQSSADNLVAGDSNSGDDIFVFDRNLLTIKRVSIAPNGTEADGACSAPSISGDGSFVAFTSIDPNLAGSATGADEYIYIVDTANAGTSGSIILVPIPRAPDYVTKKCLNPSISSDGNFVAFEFDVEDGNASSPFHYRDVYVYNRVTDQNTRITGNSETDGADWDERISQNPSISGDGSVVAFESNTAFNDAGDLVGFTDVYVANLANTVTISIVCEDTLGELGESSSVQPAISDNGRFVTFQSTSSNFSGGATNGDYHVYRKELSSGTLLLVEDTEGDSDSFASTISADGSRVSYLSDATNLIPEDEDANGATDVFVATFAEGPAVLAFKEDSSATAIVDVTGNYNGTFPSSDHEYTADAAMDESGKVVGMGSVDTYTHPTRGSDVRLTGRVKTVNNTPTVEGGGSVKGGTLDGDSVGGKGKITVPLVVSSTDEGPEFRAGVASGSGSRNGETFKQIPTVVDIPTEPDNIAKDWSLALSIYERIDSKGRPYLAASSTLYLPNGDKTQFAEKKLSFSTKTGTYSISFASGIKIDAASEPILNAKGKPVVDRKSRVIITEMTVEATGEPRQPTGGMMSYKFLGQKGSGDLLSFF